VKSRRRLKWIAAAASAVLVCGAMTACSGGGSGAKGPVILNVAAGPSGPLSRVFNPFLTTSAPATVGGADMIYEPLVQQNILKPGSASPWLSTSWAWSDGNKKLTFQLRQDVKWSDGQPFSAADVVYTYGLLKKYEALNINGISFSAVKSSGPTTVELDFAEPSEQNFYFISTVPIVSQHIWSKVSDPVRYDDANPVGTGPFTLSTFSPQSYLLLKNPRYWQPGKPAIGGLQFLAKNNNTTLAVSLAQGELDWTASFVPNVQKSYANKSSHNKYWWPVVGTDGLIPNLLVWPMNLLPVRQAISLGVDRKAIADSIQVQPAWSPTGLPMPNMQASLAPEYQNLRFKQDQAQARKLLTGAGFTMGSDGYFSKDGKQLAFVITDPSSYTDQITEAQVIIAQMKQIGIKVTINGVSVDAIAPALSQGHFQASLGYPIANQPTDFDTYNSWLNEKYATPIGTPDLTYQDIQRWYDPATKKFLADYVNASTPAQRKQAIYGLQKVMVDNLPIIPLTYFVTYGEYNDSKVTGWPTAADPYAPPGPSEVVALRLVPVK
jgi:peptide/nickel transport system substrate-binding protein